MSLGRWRSAITGRFIKAPAGVFAWIRRWFAVREMRKIDGFKIGGTD